MRDSEYALYRIIVHPSCIAEQINSQTPVAFLTVPIFNPYVLLLRFTVLEVSCCLSC